MILFKKLGKFLFVLLVLCLLICFWLRTRIFLLTITVVVFSLARRKKSHEVTRLHKFAILIDYSNCDNIIVCVNLMHDSTHNVVALTVLYNLVVLLAASFFGLLLMIQVFIITSLCREGSGH